MKFSFKRINESENKLNVFWKRCWNFLTNFYRGFSIKPLKKEKKPRKLNIAVGSALALIGIIIVYQLAVSVYGLLKDFDIKTLFFSLGDELKKDGDGYTNFLLLGIGGEGHDGADLTDTMIVASLDEETKSVVMLSIPRDFYVSTEYYGSSRINEIMRNVTDRLMYRKQYTEAEAQKEAIDVLTKKITEITELDIQYYALIDFQGFQAVVDDLGGIDVEVKNDLYDASYPADKGWGYQVFKLKAGPQHLDGKTALKYARSRHSSSDFDRAMRQQQVIQAIKDKALSLNTLTSPSKIRDLYYSISNNFSTNLTLGEMLTVGRSFSSIPQTHVISNVLTDDRESAGGFLATPPRNLYNGAYVLVPFSGDLEEINRYAQMLFKSREIYLENARIEIQNGTKMSGIASEIGTKLKRYSFNIAQTGNTPNKEQFEKTKIIFKNKPRFPATSLILPILISAEAIDETPSAGSGDTEIAEIENPAEKNNLEPQNTGQDIVIIVGQDYKTAFNKL